MLDFLHSYRVQYKYKVHWHLFTRIVVYFMSHALQIYCMWIKLIFNICSQLHICLYDFEQYHAEAWNLLCGSRPDWLSIKNKQGFTPLMLSVLYGAALEMVRALALLSFSLPLADSRGNTALHYAAYMGRLELVDAMLLEPTPEEYQLVDSFLNGVFGEPFTLYSFEQVLLRHRNSIGSLLSSPNATGETPLYCAVKSGNLEVTRRLLEMRSDPRIKVSGFSMMIFLFHEFSLSFATFRCTVNVLNVKYRTRISVHVNSTWLVWAWEEHVIIVKHDAILRNLHSFCYLGSDRGQDSVTSGSTVAEPANCALSSQLPVSAAGGRVNQHENARRCDATAHGATHLLQSANPEGGTGWDYCDAGGFGWLGYLRGRCYRRGVPDWQWCDWWERLDKGTNCSRKFRSNVYFKFNGGRRVHIIRYKW